MAAPAVVATTTNTRVFAMDAATSTGHFGGSGPAPAAEAPLAYQNLVAVNKKNASTAALQGIDYDPGSGAVDATTTPPLLWIAKTYVSDFADLNATYGHSLAIGSSNANYKNFNVAGSGEKSITGVYATYPAAGGYLITAIDVNLGSTSWDNEVGTTDETAIDYFGVQSRFITGSAKAENQAIDAIDMGTGLELHAGDGGSTDASMQDLVDADEGTSANRWGYVRTVSGIIYVLGRMDVGRSGGVAAITEFTETASTIVIFPDGYFTAGSAGMLFDIGNASSVMTVPCQFLGKGGVDANTDSRPDHVVVGTSGAYTFTGTMLNHRNVTFTAPCDVAGTIECKLLTQGSANIENAKIITSAITNVACLQDPTFGTSTDLNNTEFEQGVDGVGHAIEIDTAGTYDLEQILFTGYGGTPGSNPTPSSGAADAAIFNSSGGLVTLNVNGDTPSVRNNAVSTTVVTNTVNVSLTNLVIGSQCYIFETATPGNVIMDLTADTATETVTFSYVSDTAITIRVRKSSAAPKYLPFNATGTITGTGFTLSVGQILDPVAV
jgi:hypothetical protein